MTEIYDLREYQKGLVDFILRSLASHNGVAIEAPTGSGKTVTGLIAATRYARENRKKVLYLTRTNSQQEQVIKELRIISPALGLKAVPIQGRYNLCPLYMELEHEESFTSDSLSRFCNNRKRRVREGEANACRYFSNRVSSEENLARIFSMIPTAEEFLEYGREEEICPYESLKAAAAKADVVVAPYAFFLNPDVAERFLSRWGVSREDLVIVMDEAHNIPDLAREVSSFRITMNSINLAEKEAAEFGDPELEPRFRVSDFCETMRNAILDLVRDKLGIAEESRIRFSELPEYAAIGSGIKIEKFWFYASLLSVVGDNVCDLREEQGRVPRSHILALASRLLSWKAVGDEGYVAILNSDNGGTIEAFCLEPISVLENLKASKTIHMSGTLEPFAVYKNITGFTDIATRKLGKIFPEDNRLILYYDGISTKFDSFSHMEAAKMRDMISAIIASTEKKSLVFFTSYNLMEKIIDLGFSFDYLAETRDKGQADLMAMLNGFRSGN
ncbi:MAG: ATP-dependent DNA helicase, partial [Candidatus Thermoplasmatota archaeon]|nr:ATP-dependent DNA helicase [Candidatus Thermoplasmatota archaeon]